MNSLLSIALSNSLVALALAVLVWGLTRLLRNPPLAHLLWLLVLLKLVAPPLVHVNYQAMLPVEQAEQAVSRFMQPAGELPHASDGSSQAAASSEAGFAVPSGNLTQAIVIALWFGGAAICAGVAVARIVHFERRLRDTLPASARLQGLTAHIAARLDVRRVPQVRYAQSLAVPLLWCAFRPPLIVLPLSLQNQLDDDRAALILAHELAHLRRRDHWVRGMELCVATLFWWNPLVWFVRRRIHEAEDLCCDAWVRVLFPDCTTRYATLLFETAESVGQPRGPRLLPATSFLQTLSLKARIEMILENRFTPSLSKKSKLAVLLTALLSLPTFVAAGAPETPAATERLGIATATSAFPYVVKFEQGATHFDAGDNITILEVRGTAETFQPGHIYWIRGTYKLASRDKAGLSAYTTAKHAKDGTGSSYYAQSTAIERGGGTFTLFLPMACEGWPHVSFYPRGNGSGFGGNYFGTGETVLKKGWD